MTPKLKLESFEFHVTWCRLELSISNVVLPRNSIIRNGNRS